ncbi:uncharacterized protein TRIADDRAFT_51666 [Trichoplax adhaerens]|uniref:Uncharacterized protein n=1 Tax=Trichoplax adhaerens TaxID=10228 RepID=B3RKF9_TRIAD|nr:hypothetical protein TRIADDRAFT_51666 [Trichoplax adhaerens]EDV28590.1 hypothetical protein TRIADDRAFT_51666 [Trichoplax adhaerens]|eukprot:XP_002107792.1 hypothetical protein TRIADDRAFT_51666 [Trichoplax adhaerens]
MGHGITINGKCAYPPHLINIQLGQLVNFKITQIRAIGANFRQLRRIKRDTTHTNYVNVTTSSTSSTSSTTTKVPATTRSTLIPIIVPAIATPMGIIAIGIVAYLCKKQQHELNLQQSAERNRVRDTTLSNSARRQKETAFQTSAWKNTNHQAQQDEHSSLITNSDNFVCLSVSSSNLPRSITYVSTISQATTPMPMMIKNSLRNHIQYPDMRNSTSSSDSMPDSDAKRIQNSIMHLYQRQESDNQKKILNQENVIPSVNINTTTAMTDQVEDSKHILPSNGKHSESNIPNEQKIDRIMVVSPVSLQVSTENDNDWKYPQAYPAQDIRQSEDANREQGNNSNSALPHVASDVKLPAKKETTDPVIVEKIQDKEESNSQVNRQSRSTPNEKLEMQEKEENNNRVKRSSRSASNETLDIQDKEEDKNQENRKCKSTTNEILDIHEKEEDNSQVDQKNRFTSNEILENTIAEADVLIAENNHIYDPKCDVKDIKHNDKSDNKIQNGHDNPIQDTIALEVENTNDLNLSLKMLEDEILDSTK